MKIPSACSLLLMLELGLWGFVSPGVRSLLAAEVPPPSAEAPETRYDAGTVARGDVIRKSFPVRNAGGSRLVISNLDASCNCAAADYTPHIEPGSEGSVAIRIDTEDFSGPIEKYIVATTNDPANPKIKFTVTAVVDDVIEVLPARKAPLGELPREEASLRVWTLRALDGSPLRITRVEALSGCADFQVRSSEEGKVAVLEITIPPHYEDRSGSDIVSLEIAVHTSHPRMPLLLLRAQGEIRDRLRAVPVSVRFGKIGRKAFDGSADDAALWRDLTIVYIGSEPLRIESVSAHPEFLDARLYPPGEPEARHVRLRVGPNAPTGPFAGWVRVRTNLGELFWKVSGEVR